MFVLATPIVDWTAMGKIFVAVLIAGTGVVILFGIMLLGLKISQGPATHATAAAGADGTQSTSHVPSSGARLGGFTLALVCGLLVAGVIVLGVYAMTQKPSSKPAKPKAALVIPAGPRVKLVASSG
jgi:hypothetical protein